jgi:SAM-dependent methyltransferase
MVVDRSARAEDVVEQFLSVWSDRTRKAYRSDLDDFARFRGRTLATAVSGLLASRAQCQRIVLDFAVDLVRRGRAPNTIRRRLSTLGALAELAREMGVVDWSTEIPSSAEVAAAGAGARISADPYFLPRGDAEIDRQDIQHYALREALGGRNHVAPVERPARILDVGCGTGQWAYELCAEFPDSLVCGFDLQRSKTLRPANYRFVRGNLLHGLPFTDGSFDFVHQRILASGVPVRAWARTMRELVRVTGPGGWIELVEGRPSLGPAGPATERLFETTWKLGRSMGLDTTGQIARNLARQLRRTGVSVVDVRRIEIPVGEWGGRIGSWMSTDARTVFLRLAGILEERFGLPEAECRILVAAAQQEWEEHRASSSFTLVVGHKRD